MSTKHPATTEIMLQSTYQTGTTEHANSQTTRPSYATMRFIRANRRNSVTFFYHRTYSKNLGKVTGILSSIRTTPARWAEENLHAFQNPTHRPTVQSAVRRLTEWATQVTLKQGYRLKSLSLNICMQSSIG